LASPDRKKEKKKSKLSPPAPPEWAKADQLSVKLGVKHPDKTTNDESESDAAEKTIGRATRGRSTAAAAEGQGQGRKRGKGRREDSESPPPASKRLKRGQQPHSEEEAEEAEDAAEKTIGGSGGENYRDLIGLARGFKAERVQKEGETGVVPMPGVQTIKLSDVQLAKSAWRHPKPYIKAPPPQKEPLLGVGGVSASGSGHVAALREGDGSVIDYECDSVVRNKNATSFLCLFCKHDALCCVWATTHADHLPRQARDKAKTHQEIAHSSNLEQNGRRRFFCFLATGRGVAPVERGRQVRKRKDLLRCHFILKMMIILPRQARDKRIRKESTQKKWSDVFLGANL
jgi:hypothetical protein